MEMRENVMVTARKSPHGRRSSRTGCRAWARVERSHRPRSRKPVPGEGGRVFFSGRISQHMESRGVVDWLAGVALLLAVASWGMLISLLGS